MTQNLSSVQTRLEAELLRTKNGAIFAADRRHRYLLWRQWSDSKSLVLFIGLNPSTADETIDDPTIRRCKAFARDWGASGFMIANLFAFRATLPSDLRLADAPIGPDNDGWIAAASSFAHQTIACWGNHGIHLGRDTEVLPKLTNPQFLKMTKANQPSHPLYLRSTLRPQPFP